MSVQQELVQELLEVVDTNTASSARLSTLLIWHGVLAKSNMFINPIMANALFSRAICIHRRTIPWLPPVTKGEASQDFFSRFETVLMAQPVCEVTQAMPVLLGSYIDMLVTLLGIELTQRIIHMVSEGQRLRS
jgi:hypothetical protein